MCLAATSALAAGSTTEAAAATLVERLQSLYPSTRFGEVRPTAWPGVYEVAIGTNLAYVDESGRYFLFGHLYDMQAQRDVTAERKDQLARIDFDGLPLQDALKEVRGSGARTLVIFSDPDCPHCRRLEEDIRDLTDVTIYTFLMPLASLHPSAREKAIAVWCANDRIDAWHALMWRAEEPTLGDCEHPIDRNVVLGERLGISGTPTMVAADGRMLQGAVGLDAIEAWLSRTEPRGSSARSGMSGKP